MSFVQQVQQIATLTSISTRARLLWLLLATNCQPGTSKLWIKQATFAQSLGCSRSSIGRALRELAKINLIVDMNKRHQGRYKTYSLPGLVYQAPPEPIVAVSAPVPVKKLSKREIADQKTAKIIQALIQEICTPVREEDLNPHAKQVLDTWKNIWTEKFPKLDGQSGRPYLTSCVQKATSDLGNWQYGRIRDIPEFVDSWLKTATQRFCGI